MTQSKVVKVYWLPVKTLFYLLQNVLPVLYHKKRSKSIGGDFFVSNIKQVLIRTHLRTKLTVFGTSCDMIYKAMETWFLNVSLFKSKNCTA